MVIPLLLLANGADVMLDDGHGHTPLVIVNIYLRDEYFGVSRQDYFKALHKIKGILEKAEEEAKKKPKEKYKRLFFIA
jgi:hypothetical protein